MKYSSGVQTVFAVYSTFVEKYLLKMMVFLNLRNQRRFEEEDDLGVAVGSFE